MDVVDSILKLLDDIRNRNLVVIVEGVKDVRSLNALGISNVVYLKKALFEVVEGLDCVDRVVLLTDLDSHGRKLYSVLRRDFMGRGVSVDDRLRKLLFKTPVRHIEGLATFLRNQLA